jgi:4'-phosphopantetheinyl transferase
MVKVFSPELSRSLRDSTLSAPQHDWADLWLGRPDPTDVNARLHALLDDVEAERAGRFAFDRDREHYIFAHALLRLTLAGYLDADPRALRFVARANGRPELATATRRPPLRFNVSHTNGLVACVVTGTADCGVDVESLSRVDYRDLVSAVLAPSEVAEVAALPEEGRRDRFLQIWTLKEAYLKGRGLGLAVPLREIAFSHRDGEPECVVGPSLGDDGREWRFWSGRPTASHRAAVALHMGQDRATLTIRDVDAQLRWCRTSSIVSLWAVNRRHGQGATAGGEGPGRRS